MSVRVQNHLRALPGLPSEKITSLPPLSTLSACALSTLQGPLHLHSEGRRQRSRPCLAGDAESLGKHRGAVERALTLELALNI